MVNEVFVLYFIKLKSLIQQTDFSDTYNGFKKRVEVLTIVNDCKVKTRFY